MYCSSNAICILYIKATFSNPHISQPQILAMQIVADGYQWVTTLIVHYQPFQACIYYSHLHPLQAANSCRNSRLVVDEDDVKWVKN